MNKNIIMGVVSVVLAGAFFVSGMLYGEKRSDRQDRSQQFQGRDSSGGQRASVTRAGGGFVAGEILSRDAQSITVKLRDGGSKIVLLSGSTRIMKETEGTANDLTIGMGVSITGEANPDGSINAQSVQMRRNIQKSDQNR